jgi:hypothetical protein
MDDRLEMVSTHSLNMMKAMEGIAEDIKSLKGELLELTKLHIKDVNDINARFVKDENQLKEIIERLDRKRTRIDILEGRVDGFKNLENASILIGGFDKRLDVIEQDIIVTKKHTNIYWEFFRTFAIVSMIAIVTMYGHAKGWW